MNTINVIKNQLLGRIVVLATIASLVLSALPMTGFAASTGITVNNSNLTTEVGVKTNFVVSVIETEATTTPGTVIFVSDNGGGSFYNGTTGGACNSNTVDADSKFAIESNKGVCYNNATPGSYVITVQLKDAADANIGSPVTVNVTVNPPVVSSATSTLKLVKVVNGGVAIPSDWFLTAEAEGDQNNFSINGASSTFRIVSPNTLYTLTESEVSGYYLTDLTCNGGSQDGNQIILEPGENVTCTFTNSFDGPAPETVTACKYDATEDAVEGWEMFITNGIEGEGEVSFLGLTGENGCVDFYVYPEDGPFYVVEETRTDWEQMNVMAQGYGYVEAASETEQGCVFFEPVLAEANTIQGVVEGQNSCTFYNEQVDVVEPCLDTVNTGATTVVASAQGKKKDGSDITDVNRTNPAAALGVSDWNDGDEAGFFSLGFRGAITLSFANYVNEVTGTDLTIYEATNGTYPAESASVEVSQDGTTWFPVGTAGNPAPTRETAIDFSSTGLTWIKFVRIIDTTDPALHDATADAFDVDAVVATKTTCKPPKDTTPTGACEIEGHKYDNKGNPLMGWFIGLKKFALYGEVEQAYTILNDTTDEDGYYCLEWDNVDFTEVEPGYTSFLYRVFEKMQAGWELLSIEKGADFDNLAVAEDVWYGEGEVGTQYGETNGFVLADDAYHVDFYNSNTSTSSEGPFTLNVLITGEGEGDVDSGDLLINCSSQGEAVDCSETYASGTVVTLTAVPAEGSNFDNSWTAGFGTCTGNTTPCQVVMTQNVDLIAHFDLNGSGGGRRSGGGGNNNTVDPTPTVAGISDSNPAVLGDQVSMVPFGAPGTGAGGAAKDINLFLSLSLLLVAASLGALYRRRQLIG